MAPFNFKEHLFIQARYEQCRLVDGYVGFYPTTRTCSSPLSLWAKMKSINNF